MISMMTKPANTQPTAVGTTVSTGLAGVPLLLEEQTSAEKQRASNHSIYVICTDVLKFISNSKEIDPSQTVFMPHLSTAVMQNMHSAIL